MDEPQLLALKPELDRFLDRFAPLFGRDENQAHARRFVQGLLHGGERRNAENIAQAMSGGPVRSLQAFITTGAWCDRRGPRASCAAACLEALADEDAVWNSDETGFPKKGTKSVGVKRQYSGTLGRTDNCQVAVFANYCSAKGHTFMDRRLFLPEEWAGDRDRRERGRGAAGGDLPHQAAAGLGDGGRRGGRGGAVPLGRRRRRLRRQPDVRAGGAPARASGTCWTARPMPASGPPSPGSSRPSRGPGRSAAALAPSRWSSARPRRVDEVVGGLAGRPRGVG